MMRGVKRSIETGSRVLPRGDADFSLLSKRVSEFGHLKRNSVEHRLL
jgi:hypothetical protein